MKVKDLIKYAEPDTVILYYENNQEDFELLPEDDAEREAFLTREVVKIWVSEIFDKHGKLGGRVSMFTALCVEVA